MVALGGADDGTNFGFADSKTGALPALKKNLWPLEGQSGSKVIWSLGCATRTVMFRGVGGVAFVCICGQQVAGRGIRPEVGEV